MVTQPVVAPPSLEDVPTLGHLFLQDMQTLGIKTDLETMQTLAHAVVTESLRPEGQCVMWVARLAADQAPVGVVLGIRSWSLKFGGPSVWIEELYVTPSARRHGLGRLLVETLLDWAETQGIRGVDLEAYHGNTPASVLYRSIGFHRLGRERFFFDLHDPRRF